MDKIVGKDKNGKDLICGDVVRYANKDLFRDDKTLPTYGYATIQFATYCQDFRGIREGKAMNLEMSFVTKYCEFVRHNEVKDG